MKKGVMYAIEECILQRLKEESDATKASRSQIIINVMIKRISKDKK